MNCIVCEKEAEFLIGENLYSGDEFSTTQEDCNFCEECWNKPISPITTIRVQQ